MTKISQREARRLRKQVAAMEQRERTRLNRWHSDYPGGVTIYTLELSAEAKAYVDCAQRLGHTIVCKLSGDSLRLFAVKP